MSLSYGSFPLFMAVLIMVLVIWALPPTGRLVLIVPVLLGAGVAFFKLWRSNTLEK